jgi:hypothetical protein
MNFETMTLRFHVRLLTFRLQGTVAEWLGRALQKLVQQFESARYLNSRSAKSETGFFLC